MPDPAFFTPLFRYNDTANARILDAAAPLADDALDTKFDMGPGSLRRTLLHIDAGERTWLARWMLGRGGAVAEPEWPDESQRTPVKDIAAGLRTTAGERDAFVRTLTGADLDREQTYRDSKGSLYRATLGDMIVQSLVHSVHHRAQAVNMLRRLGAAAPDIDYMYSVRRPAQA